MVGVAAPLALHICAISSITQSAAAAAKEARLNPRSLGRRYEKNDRHGEQEEIGRRQLRVGPDAFLNSTDAADLAVWRSPSPAIAIAFLAIAWIAFCVARFIARRVFLVDLVHPLALAQGYVGLRHVVCHPCDDASARRLFRDFKRIDLSTDEGLELHVSRGSRRAPSARPSAPPSPPSRLASRCC